MSNILLKILIVSALILAGLVYYSNKIIHEKPIHKEEKVVVKSVVMPHPPLSDKHKNIEEDDVALSETNESNVSEEYANNKEQNTTTIELTQNLPNKEIDESSLDEPEIVINDEMEIIDDSNEEIVSTEEPIFVDSNEVVEIANEAPSKQIPLEEPNIDLGTPIGGVDDKKEPNVDLGVQLF